MPTAAYDPGLLREQETPLVIGKNWFLDQEIPAGGYVRIQDSSQVWEERVDETRIITTEGLTTCLDPGRGWTITSGGWNFLKKQECWEGHQQALITIANFPNTDDAETEVQNFLEMRLPNVTCKARYNRDIKTMTLTFDTAAEATQGRDFLNRLSAFNLELH